MQYTLAKVRRPAGNVRQAVNHGTSWVFSPAGSFMVRGTATLKTPGKVDLIRAGDLYFVNTAGFAAAAAASAEKLLMPVHHAVPVEAAASGLHDAPMDPAAVQAAGAPAAPSLSRSWRRGRRKSPRCRPWRSNTLTP